MAAELTSRVCGAVQTNVYFIKNTETGELVIVDPADHSAEAVRQEAARVGGRPRAILLTHGHYDHFGGAAEVQRLYHIPVYAGAREVGLLADPRQNTSAMHGVRAALTPDHTVQEGEVLLLAGLTFLVLETPGHTAGGVCYYLKQEGWLFSGDTLFCESYGRTDFPTGSGRDLQASVRRLLRELPEDTKVYPGHDMSTSIAHEKRYNPLAYGL